MEQEKVPVNWKRYACWIVHVLCHSDHLHEKITCMENVSTNFSYILNPLDVSLARLSPILLIILLNFIIKQYGKFAVKSSFTFWFNGLRLKGSSKEGKFLYKQVFVWNIKWKLTWLKYLGMGFSNNAWTHYIEFLNIRLV